MSNCYIWNEPLPLVPIVPLKEAGQVVEFWKEKLYSIVAISRSGKLLEAEELEEYARWLVGKQKDGLWKVLDAPGMPRDARTDFIYQPSCIALATLFCIKERLDLKCTEIELSIEQASKRIEKDSLWMGNGYDRYRQMCDNLEVLSMGGMLDYWLDNKNGFPKLVKGLRLVAVRMVKQPSYWIGEDSGFHTIQEEQFHSVLKMLRSLLTDDDYPKGSLL